MLDFLNLIIGRHIDIKQSLDYYKTVNSKYTRRVFTEIIYKELMKMGQKFANSYFKTKKMSCNL